MLCFLVQYLSTLFFQTSRVVFAFLLFSHFPSFLCASELLLFIGKFIFVGEGKWSLTRDTLLWNQLLNSNFWFPGFMGISLCWKHPFKSLSLFRLPNSLNLSQLFTISSLYLPSILSHSLLPILLLTSLNNINF